MSVSKNSKKSLTTEGHKKELRSPLRYPGGKSRAINQIIPYIDRIAPNYDEFREPKHATNLTKIMRVRAT